MPRTQHCNDRRVSLHAQLDNLNIFSVLELFDAINSESKNWPDSETRPLLAPREAPVLVLLEGDAARAVSLDEDMLSVWASMQGQCLSGAGCQQGGVIGLELSPKVRELAGGKMAER